jgi:hypothetical protein
MELLVSLPVYTTSPKAVPEATTVFAQRVFSMFNESSTGGSSFWKTTFDYNILKNNGNNASGSLFYPFECSNERVNISLRLFGKN